MFSFVSDTVLDPFGGTFSTTLGALRANRNSIINEIDPEYFGYGHARLNLEVEKLRGLFTEPEQVEIIVDEGHQTVLHRTAQFGQ